MIKVGQTTTNQTITLPYELTNDGDTSISLNELKGNTTQNGTPTPTSPQNVNVVKGKNLFGFFLTNKRGDYNTTSTLIDVNTLQVTSTSNTYANTIFYLDLPNGTYIFKLGKVVNSNPSMTIKRMTLSTFTGNTRAVVKAIDEGTPQTITITNETNKRYALEFWATYSSALVNTATFSEVQIEQGSTATPYLPYNTIQAKVVGKNLCNLSNDKMIVQTNGTIATNNSYWNCVVDTTGINNLYVSGDFTLLNSDVIRAGGFNEYPVVNSQGTRLTIRANSIIDTSSYKYVLFCFFQKDGKTINDVINSFQIEVGTTATTYEPYKSNNYPLTLGDIELCKIGTYQDRIYKNNGKWYLYKAIGKVTFNGTETGWATESIGNNNWRYVIPVTNAPTTTARQKIFSNYFFSQEDGGQNNGGGFAGIGKIFLCNFDYVNNVAGFKTWLTTHNTIVYFRYETPTTTEITDETLLEQLDAIGELYRGTNNIMITDTIAPVENIIIEKSNAEFDLVPYIKREPKLDYIDRKGDTGYTADGHYFENIIARKRAVEFELIPMSQEDYANVISRFMNITSIPVFISDTYTNQNLKLNMFKKAIISNTQLTEYGRIRGTKISLEEI